VLRLIERQSISSVSFYRIKRRNMGKMILDGYGGRVITYQLQNGLLGLCPRACGATGDDDLENFCQKRRYRFSSIGSGASTECLQPSMSAALRRWMLVVACLVTCLAGCGTDDSQQVKLVLSGSSTVGPLVSEIGKRYESLNQDVRIDVQTGGSSRGIRDAKDGLADIGMSSRSLKESEVEGREQWPIAMDGVCFIVHADNSVGELTLKQLKGVLTGEIQNWSELGGPDAPIEFINRADGRSELELVSKYFDIESSEMKPDLIAGENQQGIKSVANTPNAISYMSVGASEEAIRFKSPIRMLPLGGVEASVKNVESGQFPLSRPLILVTAEEPNEATVRFIKYCQSEDVADLVRELSYVPILE